MSEQRPDTQQRLWALASDGDAAALTALLRALRRSPPALQKLPALAKLPPHPEVWALITDLLDTLRATPALDQPTLRLLMETDQALSAQWPDGARAAPAPWLRAATQGQHHVGWRLARAADWSGQAVSVSAAERLLSIAGATLAHITALDLSHKRWFADTWSRLLQSPHLACLRALTLHDTSLSPALLNILGASPHLDGLQHLDVHTPPNTDSNSNSNLPTRSLRGAEGARGLEGVTGLDPQRWRLPALITLRLSSQQLGRDAARALCAWAAGPALKTLDLSRNLLDDVALYALTAARWPCRLTHLDLSHNPLSEHAGLHLSEWPALCDLQSLALAGTDLSSDALSDALDAPFNKTLTALDLSDNATLYPEGAAVLSGAAHLGRLNALKVSRCRLDLDGLTALLASPWCAHLTALDLSGNPLGDAGARAIAGCAQLARLQSLSLSGCNLSPDAASALVSSRHLSALTDLNLSENHLGQRGALAFTSPQRPERLPLLHTLDLRHNRTWRDTSATLAASPHLHGVTVYIG
jgi:Leucine-rich repeat (LRR) protein